MMEELDWYVTELEGASGSLVGQTVGDVFVMDGQIYVCHPSSLNRSADPHDLPHISATHNQRFQGIAASPDRARFFGAIYGNRFYISEGGVNQWTELATPSTTAHYDYRVSYHSASNRVIYVGANQFINSGTWPYKYTRRIHLFTRNVDTDQQVLLWNASTAYYPVGGVHALDDGRIAVLAVPGVSASTTVPSNARLLISDTIASAGSFAVEEPWTWSFLMVWIYYHQPLDRYIVVGSGSAVSTKDGRDGEWQPYVMSTQFGESYSLRYVGHDGSRFIAFGSNGEIFASETGLSMSWARIGTIPAVSGVSARYFVHGELYLAAASGRLISNTPLMLQGTVTDGSNNPAQRTVRIYGRTSGKLLASLQSDPVTGEYHTHIGNHAEVQRIVLADDNAESVVFNDLIERVLPGQP